MRKAAKRGLQSNDRLFRSVFGNAQIGISVFGIDRREHYSNRAMREMLGNTEEELSHLEKWDEITHPDDRVSCAERYAALLQGKLEKDAYEQRFVGRDGRIVLVHSRFTLRRLFALGAAISEFDFEGARKKLDEIAKEYSTKWEQSK